MKATILNLFPSGVLQLFDVIKNDYWHARSHEFLSSFPMNQIEWARLPADMIFIGFGIVPAVIAAVYVYWRIRNEPSSGRP